MKFRKAAAVLLTLALGLCVCQPASFAAEQRTVLQELPVSIRSKGETPFPKETLTVELKAVEGAPLPEETTLAIRDGETGAFGPIEYTAPGYYTYQITQQAGGSSRGRYDETVFYVRVTVAWEGAALKATAAVHTTPERSDPKRDEVCFVNRYDPIPVPDPDPGPTPTPAPTPAPDPKPAPPDPTAPEPMAPVDARPADAPKVQNPADASSPAADARPTLVQTGQLNWPVPVLAGSGTVLLAVGLYRVSRSRRRDDRAE